MNGEATKRDLEMWMEDLLVRIQLRIMHPHSVIHQDGSARGEETKALEREK